MNLSPSAMLTKGLAQARLRVPWLVGLALAALWLMGPTVAMATNHALYNLVVTTPRAITVTLTWDKGNGISDYFLYRYRDNDRTDVSSTTLIGVDASTPSRIIRDLVVSDGGATYSFGLQGGTGGQIAYVTITTAPSGLSAVSGNGQVDLTWDDPTNDLIDKYQVSIDDGMSFTDIDGSDSTTTATTVTGLTNGTEYTFAVLPVNDTVNIAGEVTDTDTTDYFTTVTATPLWPAPANLAATPDNGRIHLEWDRNTEVTNYRVTTRVTSTDAPVGSPLSVPAGSGSKTTATIDSLTNGTEYTFTVLALQGSNEASESAAVNATPSTPVVVPAAPTNLSATLGGSGEVMLTWDDPGNLTITEYEYRVSDDAGLTWNPDWTDINNSDANTTATTVTGLTNGTDYTFAVRAVNDAGNGGIATTTATPVSDAPTAAGKTVTTDEDTAYTFKADDFGFMSRKSGATLDHVKITALPGANKGTLSVGGAAITSVSPPPEVTKTELDAGNFTYTPPADANGDAFASFDFKVNDGETDSAAASTITINVNPVNVTLVESDANANLEDLTIVPGTLTPDFAATTTSYSVVVEASTNSVTVTPTPADVNATVTVNGTRVDSGTASVDIELIEGGTTTITVVVTAENGTTTKTTTIDVRRLKPAVSYQAASYTAREGGETLTVTVKLSQGWDEELAIPIRVTRPETTEAGDYTVEELGEWDAQAGTGTLTFPAEETERTFAITANHDGDGDDETVELGFGELPEMLLAGEPGVATVTLEDKGLVELKVSFAQVEYHIGEGRQADIEVTVAPPADRRVEIPLVVMLTGGATDEDYSGVTATVVFEEGESEGTIFFEVLADEVNDPGEGMVLSFGALPTAVSGGLPAAVSGGEISQTTVNFIQPRTAESFSHTLEAMLAVTARSMGASAQTAIEGRFARYRQRSRLGSLGTLARAGQTSLGPSPGSGMEPGGQGYGQARLSAAGVEDVPMGSKDFSGRRGQAPSLSEISFEMPLGASDKETSWMPVLWGQGGLQRFNGDLTRLGLDYRGGLEAAHVGLDLYANEQVLAGLSFMRSWGDLDYTVDGREGALESRMNTVHPYLYWQPTERVNVWGMGGLGLGQVEAREPGRTHDFDADFRMFAGGVRAVLEKRGNHEWGVRADAFTAQLETDASADIANVSGEAHRGRLLLEWAYDRELSVGRALSLQAEAGGRFDGGDADRGSGVETGVRLGYLDANSGLDVALHGRVLVVHASDYRDWGMGVQASWDPGEPQRGFSVSLNSSLGQAGGGRTTLWNNADAVMRQAGTLGQGSPFRLESVVAYAGMKAPGLPGLLTPYSGVTLGSGGHRLRLGGTWAGGSSFNVSLEGTHEVLRATPTVYGVRLQTDLLF